jgi:guanylate kinase
MTQPGKIVVFSGPSGAGKTTLVRQAMSESSLPLALSVSATTRPARPGEVDGQDYHFLAPEDFQRRRNQGEFLESCEVFSGGDWYGTLMSEVTPSLEAGKWVVLEIDVVGARSVRERFPDALTIFVRPPSLDELESRLRNRDTESDEAINKRLRAARRELDGADEYRYQVVNDEIDRAASEIRDILNHSGD